MRKMRRATFETFTLAERCASFRFTLAFCLSALRFCPSYPAVAFTNSRNSALAGCGLGVSAVVLGINLALPYLLHRQTLLQTAGYTAISLFFVCLLSATVFATRESALSRLFSTPLLMWFGKYAYGLYVFNSIVLQCF